MIDFRADTATLAEAPEDGSMLGKVGLELGGRWRLVSPLGAGGMGEVWRARHRELGRDAAVKLLTSPSSANRARIQREARILARVRHDAIVEVFDVGEHAGTPYFIMGWIDGDTLARRVERDGPMPAREIARAFTSLLDGLAVVHDAGVVHRDLKPDNVLVARRSDGSTRLVLIDFGIAQVGFGEDKLTATGALVGTPEYMAPEVLRGRDADARADVWGAAATLYEALSGISPFRREHFVATVRAVTEEDAAPLEGVPADLDRIVRRGLARSLDARYASASAMRDALDAWLAGATSPTERGFAPTQHARFGPIASAPRPVASVAPDSPSLAREASAPASPTSLDQLIRARFSKT